MSEKIPYDHKELLENTCENETEMDEIYQWEKREQLAEEEIANEIKENLAWKKEEEKNDDLDYQSDIDELKKNIQEDREELNNMYQKK